MFQQLKRFALLANICGVGTICGFFALSSVAQAQSDKTMKFILPVSAGSGVDTITRAALPQLTKALGQTIVVDNQPGAGGIPGTHAMIKSPPDGLTLSVISNNHVIYPAVYKSVPFDAVNDITPIAVIGSTPMVIVAHPSVPAKNAKELVALLKAKPDDLNYASSGNGTILHLAAEVFLDASGTKAKHIPYKGVAPMVQDLIGGQVQFGVLAWPAVRAHVQSGRLNAIAMMTPQRVAGVDVPTALETGVDGAVAEAWFAVIGPAKMPAAEVKRVRDAFVAAFDSAEVKEAMAKQANSINIQSSAASADFMRAELKKFADLTKKIGLKLD
jgi:tripartite-type tricarboxylate transporter receptor subunit TctC